MKNSILSLVFLVGLTLTFSNCKKEIVTQNEVNTGYTYNVDNEIIYQSNVEKTRQKTPELYISILYSNLFQTTIPANDLSQLAGIRAATGDKQLADELFLNAFVNGGNAIIPTNQQMRDDIEAFIAETYLRFFLRVPTAYEVYELKKEIEADNQLTPELIYQGFALSNEYKFY
ncbi:MAG: hypothetical protein ACI9XO_000635 [Paraglaciecola sp.]|jgi:hypothetical protein